MKWHLARIAGSVLLIPLCVATNIAFADGDRNIEVFLPFFLVCAYLIPYLVKRFVMPDWKVQKSLRIAVFIAALWVVSMFTYSAVEGPFVHRCLKHKPKCLLPPILIVFVAPLVLCSSVVVYNRYIK